MPTDPKVGRERLAGVGPSRYGEGMGEVWVLPVADRVEEVLLARARAGRGAALGPDVITFGELERRLLDAAGLEIAEPLAARLLASAAAAQAGRGGTFDRVAAEP